MLSLHRQRRLDSLSRNLIKHQFDFGHPPGLHTFLIQNAQALETPEDLSDDLIQDLEDLLGDYDDEEESA